MRISHRGPPDTDEIITDEDDEEEEVDEIHLYPDHVIHKRPEHRWPKVIGVVQICSGFLTAILAVAELVYLPLIYDLKNPGPFHLGKDNCYGVGLLAGLFMILLGSSAVRASKSRRATSIRKFFSLTIVTLVLYTGVTILLILGYALQWTQQENYQDKGYLYEIHVFVTISTIMGFIFAITAFVQYFEIVFIGEYQLLRRYLACCIPCIFGKVPEYKSDESLHSNAI